MRPIKFRAWDGFSMTEPFVMGSVFAEKAIDFDWEVMQYTGLVDKNGVEIYENDNIVLTCKVAYSTDGSTFNGTILGTVVFEDGSFGLKQSYYFIPFVSMYQVSNVEVIDTVYSTIKL